MTWRRRPDPPSHDHSMSYFKLEGTKSKLVLCTKCLKQRPTSSVCRGMKDEPNRDTKRWWSKLRQNGTKDPKTVVARSGMSRKTIDKWMGFRPS